MFVAVGGERLTRLVIGSSAAVDFPDHGPRESIGSMYTEASTDGRVSVWIGSNGGRGVVHIDATGTYRQYLPSSGALFSNVLVIARDTGATVADSGVWIGTNAGPFRWRGARWEAARDGMPMASVWSLDRVFLPDGASAWTASTSAGLYRWADKRWILIPGTSAFAIHGLASIPTADSARAGHHDLFLMSKAGLLRLDAHGVHDAQLVGRAREALKIPNSKAMCTIAGADGSVRVLFGTADGTVYTIAQRIRGGRLERDASWQRLPAHIEAATRDLNAMSCEGPGRLFVGTNRGVVVVDVADAEMSRWRVAAAASASDGLPPGKVQALADASIRGIRFIGTPNGIGAIDIARSQIGPTPNLSVQLLSSGRVGSIGEGERLPNGGASLVVRPSLQTDHREEESRFHVQLIPLGSKGLEDMRDSVTLAMREDEWTDDGSRNYQALAPGEYLLRVRARDFVGREAEPFERRFTVATAPWRTPEAILAYLLCLVSVALGAHYWRVAGVHRSHARVIEGERRARASERRFRALFDESGDAHLIASAGMVTAANASALALFGVTNAHGLLGRTLESLVEMRELATDRRAHSIETTIVRTDGTQTPVSFMLTGIPGDDEELEHGVLRDLTAVRLAERERLQLEARVRESQNLESLGTLAGGVAHDFNNLLGVIRGNAELAQMDLREPARVGEHLGEILDASGRARDLVRQILTFSRRSSQDTAQVDLSVLVRDMYPMLRRILPASVTFTLHGLGARRVVDGDSTQLQQVLLNLVSNAEYALRQHAAAELEITLSDSVHPDDSARQMICLGVTDNGVGMPASVRERVFEPFYSTKPTGDGTGLGLAVLHGVVVSHHGLIRVESEEGIGTKFSILLPASATPYAERAPSRTPRIMKSVPEPSGARLANLADRATVEGGACIVLVDDEPSVARVVNRVLTRAGHVVHTFSNPAEALAFIEADPGRPDLLVTDQTMPGMTGDVLAVSARAARPDLPVLILTGFSHRLTQDRLDEVGAVAVLQKPVALPTLMAAVAQALETVSAGAVAGVISRN